LIIGKQGTDAESVALAVEFVRRISKQNTAIQRETIPAPASHDQNLQFVKDNAWGHHASCTCPMGKAGGPNAVVDSNFRVLGTESLRLRLPSDRTLDREVPESLGCARSLRRFAMVED
jgi:choline dehydrogenase